MKTLLLLWVVWILPVACRPSGLESGAASEEDDKGTCIVLGEGGGVAGIWEGHTINGDGIVYAWRGQGARQNEREAGRLPADTLKVLREQVRELIVVPSVRFSASFVRFIRVTLQDSTYEYSWAPGFRAGRPRTPYQDLYSRCRTAIRKSMVPVDDHATPSGK